MKLSTKWSIAVVLVLVGVAVANGFRVIQRGFSTLDKPSAVEAFFAETARSWAIPAQAQKQLNYRNPDVDWRPHGAGRPTIDNS
jgi:hypothetical protein